MYRRGEGASCIRGATLTFLRSDTVAPTLVFLFYRLALDQTLQEKLYEEIAAVDVQDAKELESISFLNDSINETLRLHPAIPTQVTRHTPKEGLMVGDTWISGHTFIVAPRYTMGRRESRPQPNDCSRRLQFSGACHVADARAGPDYFVRPTEFIPERWSSRPELIKDVRAFNPFGMGWSPAFACRDHFFLSTRSVRSSSWLHFTDLFYHTNSDRQLRPIQLHRKEHRSHRDSLRHRSASAEIPHPVRPRRDWLEGGRRHD